MSLVGTRPEVPKYVKKYTKEMRARPALFYPELMRKVCCSLWILQLR